MCIEHNLTTNGKLIITGDFNFHMDNINNDPEAKKFADLLYSLNLMQHIEDKTHEKGRLLDLTITRKDEYFLINQPHVQGTGLSDHFPITFHIPWKKPSAPKNKKHLRNVKNINMELFTKELQESTLVKSPPKELEKLTEKYNEVLARRMMRNLLCRPSPL